MAAGVIDGLTTAGLSSQKLHLRCYWNEKVRNESISLSPVFRQYAEQFDDTNVAYVVVKSIISGACVVKTNLTRTLSSPPAADVYVVSPVMLDGAQSRLEAEFPERIARRFRYVWFATDFEKDGELVRPGIGGSVYERLGFVNEIQKNKITPKIVKDRRSRLFGKTAVASL